MQFFIIHVGGVYLVNIWILEARIPHSGNRKLKISKLKIELYIREDLNIKHLLSFRHCSEFLSRLQGVWDIDCLSCRGGDGNYIQSQALGGLIWPAHVPGAPRGKEFHLPCNPFKEIWHCPGQALGLCSESVPTGKPSAYGYRFDPNNVSLFLSRLQVVCVNHCHWGHGGDCIYISRVKPWED